MTDYSKPIGWWCDRCDPPHAVGACKDDCMGHLIPVYAVIPEGERPKGETRAEMEASAEVVVFAGGFTGQPVFQKTDRRRLAPMSDTTFFSEADAVLWVVEGRLPE